MFKDYYSILEVTRQAKAKDIKQAYRRLALKYHPDRNPNDKSAEEKFKTALEAYQTLSSPECRSRYDLEYELRFQLKFQSYAAGTSFVKPAGRTADSHSQAHHHGSHAHTANTTMPVYHGSGDSATEQFFEYMSRKHAAECHAQETEVERVTVECPDCNGMGLRHYIFGCARCGGEGYYTEVHNSAYQSCPACRGNGYGELFFAECLCDYCDGLGIVQPKTKDNPCVHCHGYGWTLADSLWRRAYMPYRAFIAKKEECYWCNGTGVAAAALEADEDKQCPVCQGRGWTGSDMFRKKRTCRRCKGSGTNSHAK